MTKTPKTDDTGPARDPLVPGTYRKRPVKIEAVKFDGKNMDVIEAFVGQKLEVCIYDGKPCIIIPTMEGNMRAAEGSWIIKGVEGEFYPCEPAIFKATYDAV